MKCHRKFAKFVKITNVLKKMIRKSEVLDSEALQKRVNLVKLKGEKSRVEKRRRKSVKRRKQNAPLRTMLVNLKNAAK